MRAIERANIGTRAPWWPAWQIPPALSALGKPEHKAQNTSESSLHCFWQQPHENPAVCTMQWSMCALSESFHTQTCLQHQCKVWKNKADMSPMVSIQTAVNTCGKRKYNGNKMPLDIMDILLDSYLKLNVCICEYRYMCVWIVLLQCFSVFPEGFISAHSCICMHVSEHVCVPLCCLCVRHMCAWPCSGKRTALRMTLRMHYNH